MENSEVEFYSYIPRLIAGAISGALTGIFALAGACSGAVAGALAGRVSDSGLLRGAGLGAVAGAILSVEVLEASRAYWCSERSGLQSSSSMADFIEELLRGRLDEPYPPAIATAYHWQAAVADVYDEDAYGEAASKGLPRESLKALPCHVVLDEVVPSKRIYCTICLQDIEIGDMARSLPWCLHTFHLACVDQWLIRDGSCPVCRQCVLSNGMYA